MCHDVMDLGMEEVVPREYLQYSDYHVSRLLMTVDVFEVVHRLSVVTLKVS